MLAIKNNTNAIQYISVRVKRININAPRAILDMVSKFINIAIKFYKK